METGEGVLGFAKTAQPNLQQWNDVVDGKWNSNQRDLVVIKMKISILLLIPVLFIVGCNYSVPGTEMNGMMTPSNIFPEITERPVIEDTPTPMPSRTATEAVYTRTPTPFPTLTVQEISLFKKNALLPDGKDCRLPCWWGIIPGKSTLSQLQELLRPLNLWEPAYLQTDGVYERSSSFVVGENEEEVGIVAFWRSSGQTIIQISVKIILYGRSTSYAFSFSPSNILEIYGIPDRIYLPKGFGAGSNSGSSGILFELDFDYSSSGFIISYLGVVFPDNGELRICPSISGSGDIYQIGLGLLSPNDKIIEDENERDISEVTEYSKEEFYSQLLNLGDAFCFNTSEDLWR
jgi:hypothetical protein